MLWSQNVEIIPLFVSLLVFYLFGQFSAQKGPSYENTSQNGGVSAALLAARSPLKDPFTTFAVMDSDGPVSLYTLEGGWGWWAGPCVVSGQIEGARERKMWLQLNVLLRLLCMLFPICFSLHGMVNIVNYPFQASCTQTLVCNTDKGVEREKKGGLGVG